MITVSSIGRKPIQVKVLPISEKFVDYAEGIKEQLEERGIRVELDDRDEKIGFKIREARNERVPYMLIVGEKDIEAGKVSVRSRANGEEGQADLSEFIARIEEEIKTRKC